ncbi:MetQ/NlpA family ABC transporter substrate-binding protein [Bacillus chungangensis]|uniref:D-methionine transport system substrate-binding protein n=1 Tax=Bacillus chungangensis TaxID=587633 RepID=A0ABT9WV43_9BACI|nr:MetQ/NlpA family ABC transporter substrate-binding protein [Bacillus chungangensis]MDQ0176762.1 D-methionine transport system substrate-binding protein [Bacillus chungangensis]
MGVFFYRENKVILSVLLVLIIFLAGCTKTTSNEEKKTITFGFTPGPYSDQVSKGIQSQLEDEGYQVKRIEFASSNESTEALSRGEIDLNVHQSTAYLQSISKENNYDLAVLTHVPSAPQGLYSYKHTSLEAVQDHMKIGVPNDPVNMERALRMIERLGWIKVKEDVDILTISEKDIIQGSKQLTFVPLEAAQIPRAMDDLDYAILNGNFVISSGHQLSEAFMLEETPMEHRVVAVIRSEDQDAEWAETVKAAYRSASFKELVKTDPHFEGFILPDYMK